MQAWEELGVRPADILLPQGVDGQRWSCIACDQFTSDEEYWKRMEAFTGEKPGAVHIIFPEIYLGQEDAVRIRSINAAMQHYLDEGIFREYRDAVIMCRRTLRSGRVRTGLIMAADLEKYDYSVGSQSLIRATESTIVRRLPPRIAIRENAPVELPHIMLLLDDRGNTVFDVGSGGKTVYDTPLAINGGHIKGTLLDEGQKEHIFKALQGLAERKNFARRSGVGEDTPVLLFAVGDGNHSLACAKACWEKIKQGLSEQERQTHPARFALVEIVNLYDSSLEFHPIHRVVFDVDSSALLKELAYDGSGAATVEAITSEGRRKLRIKDSCSLTVGSLQEGIDKYIQKHGGRVDYVHEEETVCRLGAMKGNAGFILPEFAKEELFAYVIKNGALPRKTFSMGEGCDKRYYFEARKIRRD